MKHQKKKLKRRGLARINKQIDILAEESERCVSELIYLESLIESLIKQLCLVEEKLAALSPNVECFDASSALHDYALGRDDFSEYELSPKAFMDVLETLVAKKRCDDGVCPSA